MNMKTKMVVISTTAFVVISTVAALILGGNITPGGVVACTLMMAIVFIDLVHKE